MAELILTEEQARILAKAGGRVTVRDPRGIVVGSLEPSLSPEEIAELKRKARSPGPFYTGGQVQACLQELEEEWQRTGGFDQAHMAEFLKAWKKANPGHMRQKDKPE